MRYFLHILILLFMPIGLTSLAFGASVEEYRISFHSAKELGEAQLLLDKVKGDQEHCFQRFSEGLSGQESNQPSSTWISFYGAGRRSLVSFMRIQGFPGEILSIAPVLPLVEISILCQPGQTPSFYEMRQDISSPGKAAFPVHQIVLPESGDVSVALFSYSHAGAIFPYKEVENAEREVLFRFGHMLYIFLLGGLFAIGLYNTFLWLGAGKRLYKANVFYVASVFVLCLVIGDGYAFLLSLVDAMAWAPAFIRIINALNNASGFFASCFALAFLRLFLHVEDLFPKTDRFLKILLAFGFLSGGSALILSLVSGEVQIFNPFSRHYGICVFLFSLFAAVQAYRNDKNRLFLFYIMALIVMALAVTVFTSFLEGRIPFTIWTKNSLSIGVFLESLLLSISAGYKTRIEEKKARDSAALYSLRLQTLNQELENKVMEKTTEVRSLLAFVDEAIFTLRFVGDQVVIGDERSDQSRHVIASLAIEDLSFKDLLQSFKMDPDEKAKVHAIIEASLGEDPLSFDLNAEALPRRVELCERTAIVELSWTAILSSDQKVHKILVSARDISNRLKFEELRILSKEADSISLEILKPGLQKSLRCLNSIRLGLKIAGNSRLQTARELHTAKGLARTFGLDRLSSALHSIEAQFADARLPSSEALQLMEKELEKYEQLVNERFAFMIPYENQRRSTDKTLSRWLATSLRKRNEVKDLEEFLHERLSEAQKGRFAADLFSDFRKEAARLASLLGKPVPELRFEDDSPLFIDVESERAILSAFSHIIRNAIDHGLETEELRLRAGKSSRGRITIRMARPAAASYQLIISDDGQGADADLLMARLSEKPHGTIQADDFRSAMFLPGLSTKDDVSEVSGRGMGLDAARSGLRSVGGDLLVEVNPQAMAAPGKIALLFILCVPQSLPDQAAKPSSPLAKVL